MKKTNQTLKTIIAIAAVTVFVACKKDLGLTSKTSSGYIGSTGTSDSTMTKKAPGYTGSSTLGDSTATKKGY